MVDVLIFLAYGLALLSFVLAVVFPAIYLMKNFKEAKGTLIGIGILATVILISYILASSEFVPGFQEGVSSGVIKFIGTGLNAFYMMVATAIITAVYTEVSSAIK